MQQFLSDVDRALATARSVPAALKRVARAVVPLAADCCLIFLVDGNNVRCAAATHTTAQGQRLLRRFVRLYAITVSDPVSTVAHVVRTGRPHLREAIHTEAAFPARTRPVLTLHQRLALRSALVVPIGTAPRVLGAISLAYAASGRRYKPQDVPAAMRLARLSERLVLRHRGTAVAHTAASIRRPLRLRARA